MKKIVLRSIVCLALAGCGGADEKKEESAPDEKEVSENTLIKEQIGQQGQVKQDDKVVKKAFAVVQAKSGSEVVGAVDFMAVDGGVRVVANIGGLSYGKHGFHIHEHGDCSAADASSAGGHFNPFNKRHGGPKGAERHEGDLGNLDADQYGFSHYDQVIEGLQLNGEYSIIGKSIVIHEDEDDLTTDPSGNSGKRIGCGEIVSGEIE